MSSQPAFDPSSTADIFDRLKVDHDKHRELFRRLESGGAGASERSKLFEELTYELKGHAAAEEQALYSTVLRKPPLTSSGRHSVAEHHEIEELLNDAATADPDGEGWSEKLAALRHRYLHHIEEEEDEMFPLFAKELTETDAVYMREVFDRRKAAEKDAAEVTPEAIEDAKE